METWREIVDEMRGLHDVGKWLEQPDSWSDENCVEALRHYSYRIEAACKALEDENTKLRRALEPVIKCDGCPMTQSETSEVLYAVRKAQAIMKEGEK